MAQTEDTIKLEHIIYCKLLFCLFTMAS